MSKFDRIMVPTVVLCALASTGIQAMRVLRPAAPGVIAVGEESGTPSAVKNWQALTQDGHRFGPADAAVVIVEFADFECPACRQFHLQTIEPLRDSFPSSVAVVFRHWPLSYHRFAVPAAEAFECAARQGKAEEYFDLLYRKQDSLGLKRFEDFATEAGVPDGEAFRACLVDKDQPSRIQADAVMAQEIGGTGTPTVVINGFRYPGVPTRAHLWKVVDSIRAARAASS